MKKLIAMICILAVAFLSSCSLNPGQTPTPSASSKYGPIPFPGLEWGMTKQEIMDALHLQEDQLSEEDNNMSFAYETDEVLFGCKLTQVAFIMTNDLRVEPSNTPRLLKIRLSFADKTPESFSVVKSNLEAQYGEPSPYRTFKLEGDKEDGKLVLAYPEPVYDNLSFWYSPETVENQMTGPAKERFRSLLLERNSAINQRLDSEENWKIYQKNCSLVEVQLDFREDSLPESDHGKLVYDGTNAYYTALLNGSEETDES